MLTLILGPMKSGKSLELISRMSPYEFTDKKVLYIQPNLNTRDFGITSRAGVNVSALTVDTLQEVTEAFDVIGIDEIHMFNAKDVAIVKKWLHAGKMVYIAGLDLDYRGKMPPVIVRLMELKPEETIHKLSVCDNCKQFNAQFTQILQNETPVLSGLPTIVVDDGSYIYEARCRQCYISK